MIELTDKKKKSLLEKYEERHRGCAICPGCKEYIRGSDELADVEYIKTKRGTEVFLHRGCFEKVWRYEIMKSSDTGDSVELIEMLRQDAVEKYKEEHGWIPTTERLPDQREFIEAYVRHAYAAEFLVTIEGADKATTLYYSQTGVWFDEQGEPYKVVAWMPLPERYQG